MIRMFIYLKVLVLTTNYGDDDDDGGVAVLRSGFGGWCGAEPFISLS